jgi:uncharacterized protein YkwD
MRKPAVVVTVAVSAVLAGGIMVVAAAGAEDTPTSSTAPSTDLTAPYLSNPADGPGLPAVPMDPTSVAGRAAPGTAAGAPARPGNPAKPATNRGTAPRAATTPGQPTDAAKRPPPQPGAARAAKPADGRAADLGRKRATDRAAESSAQRAVDRAAKRAAKRAAAAAHRAGGRTVARPARRSRSIILVAAGRDRTRSRVLSDDPRGSVQRRVLELVNHNRRRGGCGNLTVDRRLVVAANRHASEMGRRDYFAHKDARGGRAGDRVRAAGYRWSRYSENIAHGQDSVGEVVRAWMRSRAHRENIMNCDLREVGVGLAFAADGTPYWVQDFASPR